MGTTEPIAEPLVTLSTAQLCQREWRLQSNCDWINKNTTLIPHPHKYPRLTKSGIFFIVIHYRQDKKHIRFSKNYLCFRKNYL